MDLSRKAKRQRIPLKSKNHLIVHFCFQSDILIYNFVSTTSPLSKFRNQTHVIARALARPVENKVVLVAEIIDRVLKLFFFFYQQ